MTRYHEAVVCEQRSFSKAAEVVLKESSGIKTVNPIEK